MKNIAVIGLGEVGSYYALGLAQGGANVKAFDILMLKDPENKHFSELREQGIHLAWSMEELLQDCDMVLALTTANAAVVTAESAKPYLKAGQIYVEFNSAVPAIKEKIQGLLTGIDVVDGTTMASAKQLRHKTPVNISGERGKEVSETLNQFGMYTSYIGDKVGQAAALKVLRSIFMKGFEASLMECLISAQAYGISEQIMDSILEFFETKPMEDLLNMFVTTDVVHAARRGEEMDAIQAMLEEKGLNCVMTMASAQKLHQIADLGTEEYFDHLPPVTWQSALKGIETLTAK